MSTRLLWPDAAPSSDLNVTMLLEQLAGEPIRAQVLHQGMTPVERSDTRLDHGLWAPGEEVLRRAVVLRGETSDRAYLHATSSIAVRRLPPAVSAGLLCSDVPFGRLLRDAQVCVMRTDLTWTNLDLGDLGALFDGLPPATLAIRRSYAMRLQDCCAVARITETFPMTFGNEALSAQETQ
jgi:chorismate-pyruvate lyase